MIHLVFGASASLAGAVGAKNPSIALTQASQEILSSLQEQPSATGGFPTFNPGMSAPSIQVGAGGKGQPPPQAPQGGPKSMSDAVGEMAEKTSEARASSNAATEQPTQETTLRERGSDEPPNPKKRMWEENDTPQDESRQRDEL